MFEGRVCDSLGRKMLGQEEELQGKKGLLGRLGSGRLSAVGMSFEAGFRSAAI